MTGDGDDRTPTGPDAPVRRNGPHGPDGNGHGMGERQNGSGAPDRRRVRPDDRVPSGATADPAALETLLAAAIRGRGVDAEAEQRAVAAFRAARDAGAHRTRTRRRDDWRPREQRRAARSLKTTLSVFVASLTLGGVAVAAIGTVGSSSGGADDERGRAHASASTEARPGGPSAAPSSGRSGRPDAAQDTEAHCRAYEQVSGRGEALNSTAWRRLLAAAGGEANVRAYCAEKLARATAESKPGKTVRPSRTAKTPKPAEPAAPAETGAGSGNSQEKADKAKEKKN
ncbi:hypothetical protein ACFWWT_32610 [Streptomyces sp. NPDC058676]|uniref:hypothetical protein n=1 Tax=unclassified Streptomyces TaxID=2593676 RepID=UPI003665D7FC